jgi:hypothetical protein
VARQAAELEAAHALAAASRRVARRTLAGLIAALLLALIAIGMGIYARSQAIYARSQTAEAVSPKAEAEKQAGLAEANFREGQKTESHFRAEQAQEAGADAVTAALLALEGLPDSTASVEAQRPRRSSTKRGAPFTVPTSSSVNARFWAATPLG